jgi:hypothetical protein
MGIRKMFGRKPKWQPTHKVVVTTSKLAGPVDLNGQLVSCTGEVLRDGLVMVEWYEGSIRCLSAVPRHQLKPL